MKKLLVITCVSFFSIGYSISSFAGFSDFFCSNASLRGTYTYSELGKDKTGSDFAESGIETYDGRGVIENKSFHTGEGPSLSSGSYSINADCTGTAGFTDTSTSPPTISSFDIFVSPSGDSFTFVQTSPITPSIPLVSGEEKRVSKSLIRFFPFQ